MNAKFARALQDLLEDLDEAGMLENVSCPFCGMDYRRFWGQCPRCELTEQEALNREAESARITDKMSRLLAQCKGI